MQRFMYRTFVLNVFMETTDVYDQQPPNSLYLSATRIELLRIVSENISVMMPIDFCLNEITLNALESDKYPPSLLEGHEDDPLDEKQSNFVEIFVYIIIYE